MPAVVPASDPSAVHLRFASLRAVVALLLVTLLLVPALSCRSDFPEGTALNPIRVFFVTSAEVAAVKNSAGDIVEKLHDATGYYFDAVVATSYQTAIEGMGTGDADIAFLPTFAYITASDRYGAEIALVTVRYGETFYRAQFIARADSGITTLEDCEGRTWGFSDHNSTSGYIIPAQMFDNLGLRIGQEITTGGHPNTVQQVYERTVDFGTTYWSPEGRDARATQLTAYPDVFERVKIVKLTDPIPNDTVTFRRHFDAPMKQHIVDALIAYAETETGHDALYSMYNIDGLRPIDDDMRANYEDFRKLVHGEPVPPREDDSTTDQPLTTKGEPHDPYLLASNSAGLDAAALEGSPFAVDGLPAVAVALPAEGSPAQQLASGAADFAVLDLAGACEALAARGRIFAVAESVPGVTTRRISAYGRTQALRNGLRSIDAHTAVAVLHADETDDANLAAFEAYAHHLGAGATRYFSANAPTAADLESIELVLALEPLTYAGDPTRELLGDAFTVLDFSPPFPALTVAHGRPLNPAAFNGLRTLVLDEQGLDARTERYPGVRRFLPADKSILGDWPAWIDAAEEAGRALQSRPSGD